VSCAFSFVASAHTSRSRCWEFILRSFKTVTWAHIARTSCENIACSRTHNSWTRTKGMTTPCIRSNNWTCACPQCYVILYGTGFWCHYYFSGC
jgi:hypothetical protein